MAKAPVKENPLLARLKAASTIEYTATLDQCKYMNDKDVIQTPVPMLNAILSGSIDGGFTAGMVQLAGNSKMFKTGLLLLMMAAYLNKYSDAIALFYVNEFGSPEKYFQMFGIDPKRVLITPVLDIEQLKVDLMTQLEGLKYGDHVFVGIDSIGNMASRKEVEDALAGDVKADMTRAKQLKSLGRMITPHLTLKNIPLVAINHVYKEQGGKDPKYASTIVSGGSGLYLSSDNIYIVTREFVKDKDNNVIGNVFHIKAEKSRYVKERAVISIDTRYSAGVSPWSGLMDVALEGKFVVKSKDGSKNVFSRVDEHGEIGAPVSLAETNSQEFWGPVLADPKFKTFVENTFALGGTEQQAEAA